MKNSNYFFFPLALFILFLSFSPSSAHNKSHKAPPTHNNYKGCFSKIYAFGDSYTDTGNAHFLGGLQAFAGALMSKSPYGSTFFKKHMNRLCDGRLVIDFLCETLSLPNLPPYKDTSLNFSHGVNFAVAGSSALSSDYFLNHKVGHTLFWKKIPECLQTQIDWFNKFLLDVECKGKDESSCKAEMEKVLFWIGEMGVNDYSRTYGSSVSTRTITDMAVGNVCKLLKTLLDKGAKYVMVQGLPPVGCLPLDISLCPLHDRDHLGCAASANSVIMTHNELLRRKLAEFEKQYSGCTIVYVDYWSAYQTILKNPMKYQFQEPFKACCGAGGGELNFELRSLCGSSGTSACKDPSKHISWDGVHLTEAMHRHLADLFFKQGFCQPSFDKLIRTKTRT